MHDTRVHYCIYTFVSYPRDEFVAPNVTVDEQLEGFLGPVGFVCVIDPAVKH